MTAPTFWPFIRDTSDQDDGLSNFWYILRPLPWMRFAACRGQDPELFFPSQGKSLAAGKAICRTCTVKRSCRNYAEETNSVGLWAGELRSTGPSKDVQDARPVVIILDKRRTQDATEVPGFGTIASSSGAHSPTHGPGTPSTRSDYRKANG